MLKKLFLFFLLLLFVLPVFSQDFAPVGAEWYYGESFAFSGDINYIKFRSEKDTLVNGIMCRKISKRHKIFCNDRPDTEYLFTRNDTVYFFDPNFGEFQVLYVLSAQPDDMWMIKVRDNDETIDTIKIIVDSLSLTTINYKDLRTLYVTYGGRENENMFPRTSVIIERIGDIQYMFNWYPWTSLACDGNISGGLRCYEDSELGLYSAGLADACDYTFVWTGTGTEEYNGAVELFPNPGGDFITVIVPCGRDYKVELFDMNGRLRLSDRFFTQENELDLTKVECGVYVLKVIGNNRLIAQRKLVLQ